MKGNWVERHPMPQKINVPYHVDNSHNTNFSNPVNGCFNLSLIMPPNCASSQSNITITLD